MIENPIEKRSHRAYPGLPVIPAWVGRSILVSFLFLGLATVAEPSAHAADNIQNTSSAHAIGKQAFDAFQAGDYQKAIELFEKAESLHHAPTHLLFQARSHSKLGRPVEAFELYSRVIREELSDKAPPAFVEAQNAAREEVSEVEAAIAYVVLEVEGPDASGARIFVGEREIPAALVGVPAPVNPGEQTFHAEAEGSRSESVTATMASGQRASVKLVLVPNPEGEPSPAEGAPVEVETGGSRVPAYIALGLGGVGIAVGAVFTVQHFGKKKEASELFDERGCGTLCTPDDKLAVEAVDKKAATAGTVALIGYGVGVAGLGTGLALLLLNPQKAEEGKGRSVQHYFGWGEVGLTGTF